MIDSQTDILIVDDVADNRRLLARMLKRRGYKVETASDGLEALDQTRKLMPSLILLDVAMPGMDGFQVCQTLKRDENLKEIPIIFLSAHSDQVDKLRGFQVGGVDYVTKPFHFHEVAARVAAHIELFRQKKENEELRLNEQTYFDKVNQLKNELIHTMTHDLKNPLTSIKLSVSLLQRMLELDDAGKEKRYFGKIEDDIDRMLILISKLLNLAKIETTSSVKLSMVDVFSFLEGCVTKVNQIVKTNNIEVRIVPHFAGKINSIFDPEQIGSVLEKVLLEIANRVEPGSEIEICFWVVGDEVLVTISDQAVSNDWVPPEVTPNSFDEPAEPGMPIMSAVFERYGCRIWQDSQSGDYRFTLPFLSSLQAEKISTATQPATPKEDGEPIVS